jgi:hypothetical protein
LKKEKGKMLSMTIAHSDKDNEGESDTYPSSLERS